MGTCSSVYIISNLHREQRKCYHDIRNKAETDSSIMSIIIDGMDQSKASLPHLMKVNKLAANLWQLRTHLTGVIVHGHGSEVYVDFLRWPHDPNLTINVLLRVLKEYMLKIARSGGLPEKLYIHAARQLCPRKQVQVCSHIPCPPS